MTVPFTTITTPPRPPTFADHVTGLAVAFGATILGAVLTPLLALAWIAVQPALPFVVALRARSVRAAGVTAAAQRAA
jgi:hypothetical protein